MLDKLPYYRCNGNTEWRVVRGHNDYIVSCDGEVFSFLSLKKLKTSSVNGYKQIQLGKQSLYVHRIVADCFLKKSDYGEIDHINGERGDNRVENLRWCNHSQNMNNPYTLERMSENCAWRGKFGIEHNRARSVVQLSKYGDFLKKWDSMMDVERELGISQPSITNCCKGIFETAGGYKWKYADEWNPPKKSVSEIRPLF